MSIFTSFLDVLADFRAKKINFLKKCRCFGSAGEGGVLTVRGVLTLEIPLIILWSQEFVFGVENRV